MNLRDQFRNKIKQQRHFLKIEKVNTYSQAISEKLINNKPFQTSSKIAAYLPFNGEVDTKFIISSIWNQNNKCYLPCLEATKLIFSEYSENSKLKKNQFGILEPEANKNIIKPEDLDIIIIPLVAFDLTGNRLGTGSGYYDRTLSNLYNKQHKHKPYLVGLAYEFQQLPEITAEPWDIKLDLIITEKKITSL